MRRRQTLLLRTGPHCSGDGLACSLPTVTLRLLQVLNTPDFEPLWSQQTSQLSMCLHQQHTIFTHFLCVNANHFETQCTWAQNLHPLLWSCSLTRSPCCPLQRFQRARCRHECIPTAQGRGVAFWRKLVVSRKLTSGFSPSRKTAVAWTFCSLHPAR